MITRIKAIVFLALFILAIIAGLLSLPTQAAPNAASSIRRERIAVTANGTTGSAGGTATSSAVVQGQIMRIDVDYGSLTTTTDITITQTNETVSNPVVVKGNSVTDATYYPSVILTDNSGTSRTYDGTRPVVMPYLAADQLTVTISQTTAATPAVTVDVYWKE